MAQVVASTTCVMEAQEDTVSQGSAPQNLFWLFHPAKLFPIRLVSFDRIRDWRCNDADTGEDLAEKIREYHIPDFSNWKDHDAFQDAFADLLRDLRDEAKKE